jgi:CRP-like cAMP-binding protein
MRNPWRRTSEQVGLLQDTGLFSACTRDEIRRIGSLTMFMEIEQGTVLVKEDQTGREFFVVAKGTATATRQGLWLAEFGPGSFFGELALLDGGQRTATVTADTDMSLFVFSRTEFWSLGTAAPCVTSKMAVELSRRLRSADELLEEAACAPSLRPLALSGASLG